MFIVSLFLFAHAETQRHISIEDKHTIMIVAVATNDMALTLKRTIDAANFKAEIKKFWESMTTVYQ